MAPKTDTEKFEAIQKLIDAATGLPYRDKKQLDIFQNHADVVLTELFGEKSHYRRELASIRFVPRSFYSNEEDYRESWQTGISAVLKFLEDLKKSEGIAWPPAQSMVNPVSLPHDLDLSDVPPNPFHTDSNPPPELFPETKKNTSSAKKEPVDYILEVDFAPDGDAINIDDMTPANSKSVQTESNAFMPPPMEKKLPELPPLNEDSKIDKLESVVEKMKNKRLPVKDLAGDSMPSPSRISEKDFADAESTYQSVYVVSSHDELLEQEVVSVGERLGLDLIVVNFRKEPEASLDKRFALYPAVGFAIVIMGADDLAHAKDQGMHEPRLRCAQHLVFELGFLLGKLGRERLFVLYPDFKDFELPTSFFELMYTPYKQNGSWQWDLLRQLKKAGYTVDANRLL